jgi:hypothetical protein
MTREEMLEATREAMDALKRICPPQPGKAQHRCGLCKDRPELHPCKAGAAMSALFALHSVVWALPEP